MLKSDGCLDFKSDAYFYSLCPFGICPNRAQNLPNTEQKKCRFAESQADFRDAEILEK